MKNIGIIGAGASGLFAAVNVKTNQNNVTILEKNPSIGKKILMTGNGRCNITNAKIYDEFLENIIRNKKFLYSSFRSHDNYASMDYFNNQGLELVIEENDRVFPKSQKASDVVKFFENQLIDKNIKLVTEAEVIDVEKEPNFFCVKTSDKTYHFDSLIVATGGLSYPSTGSTGDGYKFATSFGHNIEKTHPSLVPIFFKDKDLIDIKAINLDQATLHLRSNGKLISKSGSILLTKNFLTGPSVLELSASLIGNDISQMYLDLVAEKENTLDDRLINYFKEGPNKSVSNILRQILTSALVDVVLSRARVKKDKKANQITKEERINIVNAIKEFKLDFDKLGGYNTAIITRGGVAVDDIDPKTMESKLVDNLYFVGEVLDIDGLTGGYNLQIAYTTAYAAAKSIKEDI